MIDRKDIDNFVVDIESRFTYSTTEKVVGKWIDGKPIYQKTVNFGTLPNNTTKTAAHGISNLKRVVDIEMQSFNSAGTSQAPCSGISWQTTVVGGNISITTTANLAGFTETYITLRYTKTTD